MVVNCDTLVVIQSKRYLGKVHLKRIQEHILHTSAEVEKLTRPCLVLLHPAERLKPPPAASGAPIISKLNSRS